MTVDLRELLVQQSDSVLASAPGEPPGDLWVRGRRRRTRRRRTGGAATVTALAAMGIGVAGVTAYGPEGGAPAATGEHADARALGYPERITGIDGEDAPAGAVAGVAWAPIAPSAGGEPDRVRTYAVAPDGRLRPIAATADSARVVRVSPNGRYVASAGDAGYQILDLTTGRPIDFDTRFAFLPGPTARIVWSPDSRQVFLAGDRSGPGQDFDIPLSGLLVRTDGTVTAIPRVNLTVAGFDRGALVGIGYLPDRHNYAVQIHRPDGDWHDTGVTLQATGTRPGPDYVIGAVALSPDGSRLALRSVASGPGNPTEVRIFDPNTGQRLSDLPGSGAASVEFSTIQVQADTACPLEWQGNRLLLPWKDERTYATSTSANGIAGDPVAIADPALDLTCVDWADDALAGERHTAFFGVQDSWIAWHPRTVLTALGGVLIMGGGWLAWPWLRRRALRGGEN